MSDENHREQAPAGGQPRLGRALARLMGEAPPPPAAPTPEETPAAPSEEQQLLDTRQPGEHGGPKGPEPTRFGDWERKGRCIDF